MTDSFSDLWASSGPAKPQQLPLRSLAATANANGSNVSRGSTPDTFSMLAAAGSSQPNSRPITPSVNKVPILSKAAPSNSTDAFGDLVAFGASTSRDGSLTIAERAAKTEQERKDRAEREQAVIESQGSFWDQFEAESNLKLNPAAQLKSNDDLVFDFLTPDLDFVHTPTAPPVSAFPVGQGYKGDDEDDILGSLAKPVEKARRVSPTHSSRDISPSHGTSKLPSSLPPHILGQIVEMGFSVEQAKVALAATESGLDVDAALEILLQNVSSGREERGGESERYLEVEVETKRWKHQEPSRARAPSSGVSSHTPPLPGFQSGIQDQADKLLAHASTVGLSMFNKANAFWKEGREKVVKVYGERAGGGDTVPATRPRWMAESKMITDDNDGVADLNAWSREIQSAAQRLGPVSSDTSNRDRVLLFTDEEPIYKSPARRRPPASGSTASQLKDPSRPSTPISISRPVIYVSPSALAESNTHKATGTECFKLGRFAESEVAYSNAIAALPPSHPFLVPLCNNRALVRLRTGDYKGTVEDCSEVVQIITGEVGPSWHPGGEAEANGAGVELVAALGKALRRRAEAREGLEKWKAAMADWEWLNAAAWVGQSLRTDAVTGLSRCRRMLSGNIESIPSTSRPTQRPKHAQPSTFIPCGPSEAVSRVRDANATQEAEDQARHDLKDVVDARLAVWRAGKETNIRALIASLDTVLWPELGWQKIGMAELVSPAQVKARYTKAISKLHPDKLSSSNTVLEQRMIANGVFGTLNEAWNAFS